jgi:hypothetical protein
LERLRAAFPNFRPDHWGSIRVGERVCFVSEPYAILPSDVLTIHAVAECLGISYDVSGNSYWRPGDTLRITFYEKDQGAS